MIKACKSLITATMVLLLFELAQSGVCPPCYRDQAVLQGHGPVSSTDNRRKLIIANDVPGTNNSKVTSGIDGAAQKWNDARDTTSDPPNSYTTPYFFQSGSYEDADFRVVATSSTSGPPAVIVLDTYPHEIRIRSDVLANLSATDLAAMIAHEVGHRIGLANWNEEPSCPNVGATIMNGSNPLNGHRMVTTEVKPMDVYLAPSDLRGPLVQFNAAKAEKDDTRKLVLTINEAQELPLEPTIVEETFEIWWPKLDQTLVTLENVKLAPKTERPEREILLEILDLVRGQIRSEGALETEEIGDSTSFQASAEFHPGSYVRHEKYGRGPRLEM